MQTTTVPAIRILFLLILLFATGCGSATPAVTYDVTITALPADGGTVSGGGVFASGDTTTLTALPADGYLFSGWSGAVEGTSDPITVTVGADLAAVAEFRAGGCWTWMGGPAAVNQMPVWGTLGVPNPANHPGSRSWPAFWTDPAGNGWLFGGLQHKTYGDGWQIFYRTDLWKFDGANWTWMAGPQADAIPGVYGTIGVANPANFPGGRQQASSWSDGQGNLYLFGGEGLVREFIDGYLQSVPVRYNDLWKFDGYAWTWMSGNRVSGLDEWQIDYWIPKQYVGVYGTMGVADEANRPGARLNGSAFTGSSGMLWLYGGGFGYAESSYGMTSLCDLWAFNGSSWAWMGGGKDEYVLPTYGTRGVAAPENTPGNRTCAPSISDASGNGWLFGGRYENWHSFPYSVTYADLWRFDGTGWAWVAGPATGNLPGQYGIRGVPDEGNHPGARTSPALWCDLAGNLWLFGGWGYGAVADDTFLYDLWKFDGSRWSWMNGPSVMNGAAHWGTLGVPGPGNNPGGRVGMASWADSRGNLWLYGGSQQYAYAITTSPGDIHSDLWRFTP